jgi:sec-independent protein translocase protein TatC
VLLFRRAVLLFLFFQHFVYFYYLVFQLPVIIYFLSRIGIVTADFLRKYRRHAFVINLIIAAIITPPDVTSQILVSLPMLLLYEVSILVAARAEKRTAQ